MKKFVSILLVLAMIVAMSTTVFAAEEETFTLIINNAAGHTYDIYQIFTGDVAEEDGKAVLSNVKYGKNYGTEGNPVPETALNELLDKDDPGQFLLETVNDEDPFREGVTPAAGEEEIEIAGIPGGYYMIVDVTANPAEGQTKSPIILQVLDDVTIASKHASITSEKKVDDKNDSTDDEDDVNWQDSADYDIGDEVPFRLTATIPATFSTYEDYTLTFHDNQAPGFSAPSITRVYILKADGTEIAIDEAAATTSGYKLLDCTSDKCEFNGCSFTVEVGDINDLYGENDFAEGDKVIVEYTAVLNDAANVGSDGNENSMYVCHPDGHTPQDDVTVLTYELKVNKIDGTSQESLEGAGFTLLKWIEADSVWQNVGEEQVGDGVTTFVWSGIDAGKYKLEETTTPAGYNTMAPMEFEVTAEHEENWTNGNGPAFISLTAKDDEGNDLFVDAVEGTVDGKLEGDVENFKGVVLPETGAEGTFFLLTGSALLIMVAAVFMITRKKMSIYED